MTRCKWHECFRPFEPTHHRQAFCSPSCQRAYQRWKETRGAPLVELVAPGAVISQPELDAEIVKIRKEVQDAKRRNA